MSLFTNFQLKQPKIYFIGILIIQLFLMLWMSQTVGISADESRHIAQAEKVYNYYQTHGEDKSALENTGRDPMQYNGQSFDNLMYWIAQKFAVKNYIEMRHFFIALIGWLIILITGLIAKKIYDYEGAILAVLLLFITPRFLGHSLNNNKDIPFALGFVLSIYGMTGFLLALPKLRYKDIVLMTLGIAFAISIRLAGILSIGFLGVFSAITYLSKRPLFRLLNKTKLEILKKLVIFVPIVVAVGFFLGIIYWPFMMVNPVKHFKEVLDATTSHPVGLTQLFDGKLVLSSDIPSYYTIRYLLITYPLVVLTGIILSFCLAPLGLKKDKLLLYFMIAFAVIFVFLWMSFKESNFYGGIRHLLFIYPLTVCLAVFGFVFLKQMAAKIPRKWVSYLPYAFIVILSLNPILHIIRNYPYSYVYFNELIGGVKKASDKYETDYFQHSLRHSTEWFVANELPKYENDTSKIKVVTNDNFNTGYYLREYKSRVECDYVRYYEKSKEDWDYAIFYCGYISPEQIRKKLWPPKGTIHTENVDGFPIGAVVKRVSHEDFQGFEALKHRKLNEAKNHFKNFLKIYPESEEVLEGYARTFLMERNLDSTIFYANLSLEYNPRELGALLLKASALNSKKEYAEALKASDEMIEIKSDFPEGHFQKGFALKNQNKPNDALKEFQQAIAYKKDYDQAYFQMGEILSNYKNYKKAIGIYDNLLQTEPDNFHAKVYKAKSLQLSGDNNQAEAIVDALPKSNQNHVEVVKVKCRIAMAKNDLQSAANYLNMARFINNDADLFVLRAKFTLLQNNLPLTEQYLKKANELDPVNREAQELLKAVATPANTASQQNVAKQEPQQQQSVMFQKPKKKKTTPITIPRK